MDEQQRSLFWISKIELDSGDYVETSAGDDTIDEDTEGESGSSHPRSTLHHLPGGWYLRAYIMVQTMSSNPHQKRNVLFVLLRKILARTTSFNFTMSVYL